jgi:hypothetical protein|tara:strand:+ start:183 stop:410 length:228 start_codon:yes stop_codon:yes gene_type:complete
MLITEENINRARLLTLRTALKLEVLGLKRGGRSAYAIVKDELGLKGSRESVLQQVERYLEMVEEQSMLIDQGLSE